MGNVNHAAIPFLLPAGSIERSVRQERTPMKNVAIVFLFALLACPIMSYGQTPPASPSPQSPALVEKSRDSYEGRVWRLDATDVTALPRNFRTTDMLFRPVEKKYRQEIDTAYIPSRQGLSQLHASGSAQFTEKQLQTLAGVLKEKASGPVYIVDLRQESHGFANGIPISWYGPRDWGNKGKSRHAVLQDEKNRLHHIKGKTIILYQQGKNDAVLPVRTVSVDRAQTEQELVREAGLHYYRITATDHLWPRPETIDRFIRFVQSLPPQAWLHFHCEAGMGRTTAFMNMYDMMKNPSVPLKDILYREYEIGGNYTAHTVSHPSPSDWKGPYYNEKSRMIRLFYQYVQENYQTNFGRSWSDWLKAHTPVQDATQPESEPQ